MRGIEFFLLLACLQFNLLKAEEMEMMESSVAIEVLQGEQIIPYLQKLAELRISFYREYPYLYEADLTDEETHLSMYANSKNSLLVVAKNGEEIIGAVTGIPLQDSNKEQDKKLFSAKNIPLESTFYLGEIVSAQQYLKSDIQQKLYQHFEKAVVGLGSYKTIILCEIERGAEDPKKPLGHSPSEMPWGKRGFIKQQDLSSYYVWKDVGDLEKTDHLMVFWSKKL